MAAYIVDYGTSESRAAYVANAAETKELVRVIAEKTSITIKQVHEISHALATHSRLGRIIWIEEANQLTIPAQNALLKMLEEGNAEFILTCELAGSLLATIRSRCSVVHLSREKKKDTNTGEGHDALGLVKMAMSAPLGERIALAGSVSTDREEALAWIRRLGRALSATLATTNNISSQEILGKIETGVGEAEQQLSANCSVALAMQHFFLHLPRTK